MLNLKKAGAQEVLFSNCTDCTNTVMGVAPKMGIPVHHQTDTILETKSIKNVIIVGGESTVSAQVEKDLATIAR